ncbi:response regulator [Microvirga aerophila]|nr:response regulator [Microvirga aerophila]
MSARGSDTAATVLLMESQPVIRMAVYAVLNGAGFNVIATESPHEAWTTLEERSDVRVLLADLDVPDVTDGLELAHKVHDRWPFLGLVIISHHIRHLRPSEVPGDGCFLPRPLPGETLLQEVAMAADRMAA